MTSIDRSKVCYNNKNMRKIEIRQFGEFEGLMFWRRREKKKTDPCLLLRAENRRLKLQNGLLLYALQNYELKTRQMAEDQRNSSMLVSEYFAKRAVEAARWRSCFAEPQEAIRQIDHDYRDAMIEESRFWSTAAPRPVIIKKNGDLDL